MLAIIIISSYVILIFFFIAISIFHPYGNWDAWMIWNTKGIHLAEGGLSWYLNDSVHSLTHTGYPLLLPSILANCWVIAKNTTTAVPVTVSLLFTLLATGVVSICITEWKGIFLGYVALVAMIITPHFFLEGQSQYADIPLSSFIVSAVVLTILNQRLFAGGFHISYLLVGVFLGFTLLLKNEGALITMCFLVASFLAVVFEKWNWKNLLMIVFGVLPFGVMLFHYKSQVPSQDHLQAIIWDFRLFDQAMSNLPLIAGYYLKNLIKVSEAIILLMFVIVLKPINVGIYSERSSRFVFIFILGVLTGYTTIYFIVSNPEFLLSTSSMRLLMHIFPTLILFVMLNLRVNKTQNFGE
ncbi:MAG TPA: hypothetical protein PKL31_17120 [Fulvivirga sp.]|nr:hypothetical protein [Fulvivirga sp.]